MEEIVAFDKDRPETYTQSRILNEVLLAFHEVGAASATAVAQYLDLDIKAITGTLKITTGMPLNELREKYSLLRFVRAVKENPGIKPEELAHMLGYSDRSSLFKAFGRERNDKYLAKYKWADTSSLQFYHYWP